MTAAEPCLRGSGCKKHRVAAVALCDITVTQLTNRIACTPLQHLFTCLVAVSVIDVLKMIDIEETGLPDRCGVNIA